MKMKETRFIKLGLSALMMIGLSACASTNIVKVSEAAPITYKMDQGATKYASLERPSSPNSVQHRRPSTLPNAPSPYQPQSQAVRGPKFNPGSVDKDLYAHQKIGKRYKVAGRTYVPKHDPNYNKTGLASWYGNEYHGQPTATGEAFNENDLTAAHKTLPLNSKVHVENLENGKTIIVRINDRGPFVAGRIIDLSKAAARALDYTQFGTARVRVRYMGPADPNAAQGNIALPPVYEEAPSLTVEAPTPKAMPFKTPDSDLPTKPREYLNLDRSQSSETYNAPIAPSAPQPAPDAAMPESEGQVTLTIKGPIRMAKSENSKARFIPAVNRKTYQNKN